MNWNNAGLNESKADDMSLGPMNSGGIYMFRKLSIVTSYQAPNISQM